MNSEKRKILQAMLRQGSLSFTRDGDTWTATTNKDKEGKPLYNLTRQYTDGYVEQLLMTLIEQSIVERMLEITSPKGWQPQ